MRIIFATILFMIAIMAVSPVFGLQQESNKFVTNLQLGESETFEWKLINETGEQITVHFSSVNDGKDLISSMSPKTIEPHSKIIVDITISVPDDYTDNVILKPMLMATQKAVVSSATSTINVAMGAKITINIGDKPMAHIPGPVIDEKVPKEKSHTTETESKGLSINKAPAMDPEPIPEPQPKCGPGTQVVNGFCQTVSSRDNSMVGLDEKSIIIIVAISIVGIVAIVSINYKMKKK